jgi:hypothetical protein
MSVHGLYIREDEGESAVMLEVKASGEREREAVAVSLDNRVKASVAYVEQGMRSMRSNNVKEVREMCPRGLGCDG